MIISSNLVSIAIFLNSVLPPHRHGYNTYSRHNNHRRMHPLSDEFINAINTEQSLWTAGRNFHESTPLTYIKSLSGTVIRHPKSYENTLGESPNAAHNFTLPINFDARTKWPYCESIGQIRDQGGCSSCWAIGVASIMTDRICTLTQQTEMVYFSDEDMLTCCPYCLVHASNMCFGGLAENAWHFASTEGVVSGGLYNSVGGCKSYEFSSCDHTIEHTSNRPRRKCSTVYKPRRCDSNCTSNPDINYRADKKKFSDTYVVTYASSLHEIYYYGPIAAAMSVYRDFIHYKSGIYRRTNAPGNKFVGNHTVKIIGWGVDYSSYTKYWLVANSWNKNWGDNGFFKIVRGENHCNIESFMTAGKL